MIFISITKFLRIKYKKLYFGNHWVNILFYNEHALQETNGMYTVSRIITEIISNLAIPFSDKLTFNRTCLLKTGFSLFNIHLNLTLNSMNFCIVAKEVFNTQ